MKINNNLVVLLFSGLIALTSCAEKEVIEPEMAVSFSNNAPYKIECEKLCGDGGDGSAECNMVKGRDTSTDYPFEYSECDCEGCAMIMSSPNDTIIIDPIEFFQEGTYKFSDEFFEYIDSNENSTLQKLTSIDYVETSDYNQNGTHAHALVYNYTLADGTESNIGFLFYSATNGDKEGGRISCSGTCGCKVRVTGSLDFHCSCTDCNMLFEDITLPDDAKN